MDDDDDGVDVVAPLAEPAGFRREVCRRRSTLHRMLHRSRRMRHSNLDHDHPFSWLHCVISVVSYSLMLSDVLRTGLGVHDLAKYFFLEPDHIEIFGPYAYSSPMAEYQITETSGKTVPFWSYKYDTTSAVMRALAERLQVEAWPPCVLYKQSCDERDGLPTSVVARMIDSTIDAVRDHASISSSIQQRGRHISLRIEFPYFDRVHHYAFPLFFTCPKRRTAQAIHYEMQDLPSICGTTSPRPYACSEAWTNYGRQCARKKNRLCDGSRTVWNHIAQRMRRLQQTHANATVDFVLLEGMDDFALGAVTFQGNKLYDVVTFARVRQCVAETNCTTIVVDDFRYEGGTVTLSAANCCTRGCGSLGCYVARSSETRMRQSSVLGRVFITVRTLFLLPSQVMIYGSLVPIMCYVVAHWLDAAAVYELMSQQFSSLLGVISLSKGEMLRVCAVSMRSVWVLALACHALHGFATHCMWSPMRGVPGVPEFVVTFVASLTAQLRFLSLRDTRIAQVEEVVPSAARHVLQSVRFDAARGFWYKFFFGTSIDYKCLAASVLLHVALVAALHAANRLVPRLVRYELVLLTRTLVPYSAHALWPTNALVVSWHGAFLRKPPRSQAAPTTHSAEETRGALHHFKRRPSLAAATFSRIGAPAHMPHHVRVHSKLALSSANACAPYFERDIHAVESRTRETESAVYLMNLGVMTDPLTFLRLRVLGGRRVGVYETKLTRRCVILPFELTRATADVAIDWDELELQFVMDTTDLDWWDLLQCR